MSPHHNEKEKKACKSYSTLAASLLFALSPIAIAVAHADCRPLNRLKAADCAGTFKNQPLAISGYVVNSNSSIAEVCIYYASAQDASSNCSNLDDSKLSYSYIKPSNTAYVGVTGTNNGLCMGLTAPVNFSKKLDAMLARLINVNNTIVTASEWSSKFFFMIPFSTEAGAQPNTTIPAASLFPTGSTGVLLQWRDTDFEGTADFVKPSGAVGQTSPFYKLFE